jgi:hypothetical protein
MSKSQRPSATTPASVTTGPAKIAPAPTLPRQTKAALLRARLAEPAGVSLAALMAATGWQAHTVRASLTGLRKAGLILSRRREGDHTIYAIDTAGSAGRNGAKAAPKAAPTVPTAASDALEMHVGTTPDRGSASPGGTAAC